MYERFTDRARMVMKLANQEAKRFNHEYIGTEHILLGLIKEGSGVAAQVLKCRNVDLQHIRIEVEKIVQSGPQLIRMGKLHQTPRAKKVVEYAMEEARNLNHNYVGTEHLLLGLIREQEGLAAQVLTNLGLSLDEVRNETVQLLADPKTSRMETPPFRTGDLIGPRPTTLRDWLLFAVVAGVALLLISRSWPRAGGGVGRSHPGVGQKLPSVELTPLTTDGDPVTSVDLAGRVVVLNFWGTWCPPCLMELPHIAQLGQRYGDEKRFKLLAVSCGGGPPTNDRIDDLQRPTVALLQRARLPLAAYADPGGQTRERLADAGLFEHGYPTNLVVDRQGIVRGVWIGYRPGVEHELAALVDELLAK